MTVFYLACIALLPATAGAGGVSEALLQKAQADGTVPIIIGVALGGATAYQAEGQLGSTAAVGAQRAAISSAQNAVLGSLAGTAVTNVKQFPYIPYMAITVDAAGLAIIQSNPNITSVQEDVAVPPVLLDSVPLIGANTAAAHGYSGQGQTVAILDTGVHKTHEFVDAGKVVSEACYSTSQGTPPNRNSSRSVCPGGVQASTAAGSGTNCNLAFSGGCSHGTHVAGIAAGFNGTSASGGTAQGVARWASIIAVQIFSHFTNTTDCNGASSCVLSFGSDQISGLQRVYALRNSYHIASVNMSLGGGFSSTFCDASDSAIKAAIDNLRAVGIATAIASGNNGWNGFISHPACVSSAVAVGSTTKADAVSGFSNHATIVDLMAPGSSIQSSLATSNTAYAFWNGTSMATPHVTGAFAVLKSKDPTASVTTLENALKATGVAVTRAGITKPRINVLAALNAIAAGPSIGFHWVHVLQVHRAISGSAGIWAYIQDYQRWVWIADSSAAAVAREAAGSNHWFGINVYSIPGNGSFLFNFVRLYKY